MYEGNDKSINALCITSVSFVFARHVLITARGNLLLKNLSVFVLDVIASLLHISNGFLEWLSLLKDISPFSCDIWRVSLFNFAINKDVPNSRWLWVAVLFAETNKPLESWLTGTYTQRNRAEEQEVRANFVFQMLHFSHCQTCSDWCQAQNFRNSFGNLNLGFLLRKVIAQDLLE